MSNPLKRLGFVSASSMTVPCAGVCAAYPVFGAPLAAVGLGAVGIALHGALWFVAPLNMVFLWTHYRRHRDPTAMLVAGPGVLLILMALVAHFLQAIPHNLIWSGLALLGAGALIDWRAQKRRGSPLGVG